MVGMALDLAPPLIAKAARGKGPRTKRQALKLRARRLADAPDSSGRPPWRGDDASVLRLEDIGRSEVIRPGRLFDPRGGRRV